MRYCIKTSHTILNHKGCWVKYAGHMEWGKSVFSIVIHMAKCVCISRRNHKCLLSSKRIVLLFYVRSGFKVCFCVNNIVVMTTRYEKPKRVAFFFKVFQYDIIPLFKCAPHSNILPLLFVQTTCLNWAETTQVSLGGFNCCTRPPPGQAKPNGVM